MVIFHSYVKLPEGSWRLAMKIGGEFSGIFRADSMAAMEWLVVTRTWLDYFSIDWKEESQVTIFQRGRYLVDHPSK